MNEYISMVLAQHFVNLGFVSKAAGVVKTLPLEGANNTLTKEPIAPLCYTSDVEGVTRCEHTADYYSLTPNSREVGVLYFEDMGAKKTGERGNKGIWKGELQLVCWLNMKRIGGTHTSGSLMISALGDVPTSIDANGAFLGAQVKPGTIHPKDVNPFKKYTYNEAATQYLILPYDHFSFNITYTAFLLKGCSITIAPELVIC